MLPRRPATEEEATALASAVRLRILRLTFHEALTNKEIAGRLGRDPATTLHHVRKLVDTGFLQALPVRRGTRGSREKPYRATGLSWSLDGPEGEDEPAIAQAMFEAFLGEVAVAGFRHLDQSRLALRLPPEELAEFRQRLFELLTDFASRPVRADQPMHGVYVAMHPMSPNSASPARKRDAVRVTMDEV
ncbi:MAG TPA: winged helix-turn-helix domain-containing protein [Pseudonocardiaceae bacterium]